jgi:glycosyltransferase involved in cell wall biosynthesis
MIICNIITTLVFGGAERLLVNYTNVLSVDHQIHIIYLKEEPKLKDFFKSCIKIHYVPLGWNSASLIRNLIKEIKPDVVHTHLGHADLIGMWAVRRLPVKLFCTMHNVYFKWNWVDNLIFYVYRLAFTTYAKKCRVSCISQAVAKHVNHTLGVSLKNISINYNAIPDVNLQISKAEARRELKLQDNDFILLTIGRLRVQKSTETLLLAMPFIRDKIKGLKVLIIGEGELEKDLKNISTKLELDLIVNFIGGTTYPEKYLLASDIFVLPSVFEGLPTVVLEAFRASIPVIASDIDGVNELINHEVNGLLFEPKNSVQLGNNVMKLFYHPEFRNQLGFSGYTTYKSKYDIKTYASEIEALYKA